MSAPASKKSSAITYNFIRLGKTALPISSQRCVSLERLERPVLRYGRRRLLAPFDSSPPRINIEPLPPQEPDQRDVEAFGEVNR